MSTPETVAYEQNGAVALVTLSRPDSMNGFNTQMRKDLLQCLTRAADADDVRVVVLTGEGRCFSAGADLKESNLTPEYTVEDMLQQEYRPALEAIINMPKAVISAVNGSAAGIGLSFALACDLTAMADKAFLLSPFTTISLVGDGGINWLLARQLGYKRAFELSILGERIVAEKALSLGLVNRVFPAATLVKDTLDWAQEIAARAPLSIAATKKTLRYALSHSYEETFDIEAGTQLKLLGSEDNIEGVTAFFEKRAPKFKGR